ncbi:DNA translocase FtsK 4TM domain-containing protein, partial [Hydrogenophaga sp.]|uniref:DNA translocase FtsK n=1 Tax=Hydrogenophaga sp. TaxID=1904254 RepID=UPI003AF8CCE7
MTYSLNTLNADRAGQPQVGVSRFAQEIGLVLGAAALAFWLLALLSHSLADPAWSTTGTATEVGNWGGRLGALLADWSYYLFGFSVWWCFLTGVRAWLSALAGWIRGTRADAGDEQDSRIWHRPWARRGLFWLALITLMAASTVLEWSRLYRLEALLPGHAGGVLGHGLGAFSMRWLGFTGSALTMLALLLVCLPSVFRFSWGHWAEEVGHTLDGWFEARREKREAVEDQRIGEQAAREREEVVKVERVEIEEHHAVPVVIEPTLVDVPKSDRVAKERQKPLFTELPDSKLPQVDLLDSAPVHQAGVDSQTLEMTSRLIEKKLKDFGVDVRVVAA